LPHESISTFSMSFSNLPTEMLCDIWKHIRLKKDLAAIVQVNRRFYQIFNKWLYCFDRKYSGNSALFWAAGHNETHTAQMSLEEKVSIQIDNDCLQVALQIAVKRSSCAIIGLLAAESADLNIQTALKLAVELGFCSVVKKLNEHGADIRAPIDYFGYLLQMASWLDDQEMVNLLIEYGADVNAPGGKYGSALQAASWVGSWTNNDKIIRLLLSHGANVNAQGGYFGNALQAASWGYEEQIVTLLINHGANVNAQGGYFGNALQAASQMGYMPIVKLLLREGADVDARGGYYGSAYQAASLSGHKRVEGLLLYWHWRQHFSGMMRRVRMFKHYKRSKNILEDM
jgi:ankyrin repeat protein